MHLNEAGQQQTEQILSFASLYILSFLKNNLISLSTLITKIHLQASQPTKS
jgi:hypothetical protein